MSRLVTSVNHGALPVLYSFRRCPYAIRARMALLQAELTVELREVVLSDKPPVMLEVSPKGSVPVLVLPNGQVIEESLAIMRWALAKNDPESWLAEIETTALQQLLAINDGPFKQALDGYKYPERHLGACRTWRIDSENWAQRGSDLSAPTLKSDRHTGQVAEDHRAQGEAVLIALLEQRLRDQPFLNGVRSGFADVAIFPFVRQWAAVDAGWFKASRWGAVRAWLNGWLQSEGFGRVMQKYPVWKPEQPSVVFPPPPTDR